MHLQRKLFLWKALKSIPPFFKIRMVIFHYHFKHNRRVVVTVIRISAWTQYLDCYSFILKPIDWVLVYTPMPQNKG